MALKMASQVAEEIMRLVEENGDMPLVNEADWSCFTEFKVVAPGEHVAGNDEAWMVAESGDIPF